MTVYVDDAPHVVGAVSTLLALCLITFGLRIYVRSSQKMWGMEDYVMSVALLPFFVISIACILGGLNGIGAKDASIEKASDRDGLNYEKLGLMYFFIFEVFYCATIIPVKLSISLMLIRIAQNRKGYIWASWGMMALFFLANTGACFYIIFECKPVSYAWNTDQDGYCLPSAWLADIYYMTTVVNIVTDWMTAILPIPLLWHVRLEKSEKISVAGILGLGVFASLAACIRLNYTINLTEATNYLFAVSNIVIWGYFEVGLGVLVGCLATLRPLFRQLFRLGSLGSSNPKSRSGLNASGAGFPSNSRRTYDQFGSSHRGRADFEMGDIGTTSRAYKGSNLPSTPSDDESMERMLIDSKEKGGMGNQSIVVSRQVHVQVASSPP